MTVSDTQHYPVKHHIDRLARKEYGLPMPILNSHLCSGQAGFIERQAAETFGALWNYGISLDVPALSPDGIPGSGTWAESGYRSTHREMERSSWHGPCSMDLITI